MKSVEAAKVLDQLAPGQALEATTTLFIDPANPTKIVTTITRERSGRYLVEGKGLKNRATRQRASHIMRGYDHSDINYL